MNKRKGFTLVEIMIVVAIIALLAAIAIPNLLRAKISANEALAKGTLRTVSTSAETYATTNNGTYPTMAQLTGAVPPYIQSSVEPCTHPTAGYTYDCSGFAGGASYVIIATPMNAQAGTKVFTMGTGGALTEATYVAP